MTVYMAVSTDKYELPRCVADSLREMAEYAQIQYTAVSKSVYRRSVLRRGPLKGCRIIRLEVSE